eukprot:9838246-Heterocapsa_arctica.AAC.1
MSASEDVARMQSVQGYRGISDERAFEAQNCPLKLRACAKVLVFREEVDGDNEDVRIQIKMKMNSF